MNRDLKEKGLRREPASAEAETQRPMNRDLKEKGLRRGIGNNELVQHL